MVLGPLVHNHGLKGITINLSKLCKQMHAYSSCILSCSCSKARKEKIKGIVNMECEGIMFFTGNNDGLVCLHLLLLQILIVEKNI